MEAAGQALASLGLTLRSGAAYGADTAFENGCDNAHGPKEIYIPWQGFQRRFIEEPGVIGKDMNHYYEAEKLAKEHHPAWDKLSLGIRPLMIRNSYQIMGRDMQSPCLFVLCSTPGGQGQGGTGQAIRIARAHDIPVFDMGSMDLGEINQQVLQLIQNKDVISCT
ncbi:hypothetical protein [Roseovarius nitratireducens]|uniref:hypothetical protein n=1 Tax=Roseovarius nitratireducens TaxID=2044597 RepID=UPI00197EAE78|nr:hypothetical protein [Roseovarius nitratireducens]